MNFNETDEFSKDFKRLSKKYESLPKDMLEFKKVVTALPLGSGKHFNLITKSHNRQSAIILPISTGVIFTNNLCLSHGDL